MSSQYSKSGYLHTDERAAHHSKLQCGAFYNKYIYIINHRRDGAASDHEGPCGNCFWTVVRLYDSAGSLTGSTSNEKLFRVGISESCRIKKSNAILSYKYPNYSPFTVTPLKYFRNFFHVARQTYKI